MKTERWVMSAKCPHCGHEITTEYKTESCPKCDKVFDLVVWPEVVVADVAR